MKKPFKILEVVKVASRKTGNVFIKGVGDVLNIAPQHRYHRPSKYSFVIDAAKLRSDGKTVVKNIRKETEKELKNHGYVQTYKG